MNDEYLWNKIGSDTEIEALEDHLAVFRTTVNKAPSIPRTGADTRQPLFAGLRIRLAFAGSATLLVAFVAVWLSLVTLPGNDPVSIRFKDRTSVHGPVAMPDAPSAGLSGKEEARALAPQTRVRQTRIGKASTPKPVEGTAIPDPFQTASLTDEERKAYDQLMLALSITSSSLKQVQDRIDGGDPVEIPLPVSESLERSN